MVRIQEPVLGTAPAPPLSSEHDAIESIVEDLSQQLSRIRQYAIEVSCEPHSLPRPQDEDEMKKLRVENDSLREELEIKDRVISLLMNKLKEPQRFGSAVSS